MKKIILLISIVSCLWAQVDDSQTALLIIDIQNQYFPGGTTELYKPYDAANNVVKLLTRFRTENQIIIHVQHKPGEGREIHNLVKPIANEKVISKNKVNCFLDTDLLDYLNNRNIKRLIICGMMTHMCVEAATRAASDFGFETILVEDACATKAYKTDKINIPAEAVHRSTIYTLMAYSEIITTREYLENLRK